MEAPLPGQSGQALKAFITGWSFCTHFSETEKPELLFGSEAESYLDDTWNPAQLKYGDERSSGLRNSVSIRKSLTNHRHT